MKKRLLSVLLILAMAAGFTGCAASSAEQTASSEDDYTTKLFGQEVITINISTTEEDWQYLMDNAASKPYISGDVEIDGVTFEDVGIKTKGNSSLTSVANSDSDRYSLKLNFGKYVDGQTCYGLDDLALNNLYGDSTYLKEYMSYELFSYLEVPSSLCTFADIYVNGEHYGFLIAVEDVEDSYLTRNFGEDYSGEAYKPESMDMVDGQNGGDEMQAPENQTGDAQQPAEGQSGEASQGADTAGVPDGQNGGGAGNRNGMDGGSLGVDLVYSDDELSSYSNIFDNAITDAAEEDNERLIAALKAISEGENLEDYIDVDEVLRYTAVNVFLVNLDSYFSSMGHNYCLYEEDGQLTMIPWDYNLSFGTYQSGDASDAVNYAIDTVFSGVSAEERPIIGKLLENEEYLERYHEYLAQLAAYVTSGEFGEKVDAVSAAIDSYVQNDTTAFTDYSAFTTGVSALKTFAALRAQSVAGQLDGSIPSTQEAQSGSDALVDTSGFALSNLGGMNNGGGQGGGQGGFPGGGFGGNGENMPQDGGGRVPPGQEESTSQES